MAGEALQMLGEGMTRDTDGVGWSECTLRRTSATFAVRSSLDQKLVCAHTSFMTTIASATATSAAPAEHFFALWGDMATWPEWNTDTEWVRLDGPFVQGATGTLKPKGGPKVKFVVEKLTDREFIDVSALLGARLTFAHSVGRTTAGTQVSVDITLSGPLSGIWRVIMGGGLRKSVHRDLAALVAAAEAKVAAGE